MGEQLAPKAGMVGSCFKLKSASQVYMYLQDLALWINLLPMVKF